jgi:hypothetical protein
MNPRSDTPSWLDVAALVLAIAVALHCLLAGLLPDALGGETAHGLMALALAVTSLCGVIAGTWVHRDGRVSAFASIGWLLIGLARASAPQGSELSEILLTVIASAFVIFAHSLQSQIS